MDSRSQRKDLDSTPLVVVQATPTMKHRHSILAILVEGISKTLENETEKKIILLELSEKWRSRVLSLWGELCPTVEAITCPTPSASPPHALWKAPPQPYVKVNVDGAWHENSLQGGVGCCLHDSEGRLLAGLSQACLRNSAVEVEAEAVLEGLLLAKEENCHKIILQSDSMDVISCMRNENLHGNWRIIPLILEIRRLSSWFISIKWEWISRQANQAAHAAAALSNMRVRSMRWASQPSPSLVLVLAKDGLP
ncbi:PREDICTED: Reverse mRNAase zinc-binding domain [Prunus dulcis]|uniref:PREDICTED: Reverse mRNAase zinc-binding domain n=1 Tax=Prunus dulcis TaxID=3755 RepID=A0A5E4EI29_PRUDU|nr:PREDICTED: Reverse mRNAase zinc-binding domain [Prunus dulcis]